MWSWNLEMCLSLRKEISDKNMMEYFSNNRKLSTVSYLKCRAPSSGKLVFYLVDKSNSAKARDPACLFDESLTF